MSDKNKKSALVRPTANNGSRFLIKRPGEPMPTALAAMVREEGLDSVVLCFGGGNAGLDDARKVQMPSYFSRTFRGFKGTAISGGTGAFTDDRVRTSFEITSVPGLLAEENACCAIGSTPATTEPSLNHVSGAVQTDKYGGGLDPRHHANLYEITKPSDAYLGWNGDLKDRFAFLEELLELGYKVGFVFFNGGDVTTEEIYLALKLTRKGAHLFVVEGSGREADKFIKVWRDGVTDDTNAKGVALAADLAAERATVRANAAKVSVFIVTNNDVDGSRAPFVTLGYITEEAAAPGAETAEA